MKAVAESDGFFVAQKKLWALDPIKVAPHEVFPMFDVQPNTITEKPISITYPVRSSLLHAGKAKLLAQHAVREGIAGRRTSSLQRVVSSFECLRNALELLARSETEATL